MRTRVAKKLLKALRHADELYSYGSPEGLPRRGRVLCTMPRGMGGRLDYSWEKMKRATHIMEMKQGWEKIFHQSIATVNRMEKKTNYGFCFDLWVWLRGQITNHFERKTLEDDGYPFPGDLNLETKVEALEVAERKAKSHEPSVLILDQVRHASDRWCWYRIYMIDRWFELWGENEHKE